MAISNHERVGRALKLLHQGLYPYFEREMKFAHGGQWLGVATRNNKRVGPESSVFWDQIKCNYPVTWDRIKWN